MKPRTKENLLNAAVAVISLFLLFQYSTPLEESEFSAGTLTRGLLEMYHGGMALFVLGLLMMFRWRRVAAATQLIAALLCLPVFLYGTFPGVFRRLFPGNYKGPQWPDFVPDKWTILGLIVIVVA